MPPKLPHHPNLRLAVMSLARVRRCITIPSPQPSFNRVIRRALTISSSCPPKHRPSRALDEYVAKPARPISLRQLIFFGSRNLDEKRILDSANYVRTELPTRIAHRIRDMEKLPYVVITNPHLSYVYDMYYEAFDTLRKIPNVKTMEDNIMFCEIVREALKEHSTVIPRLAMGVLESRGHLPAETLDRFMNTLLRSRISRRVIAEQHLSLTDTFLNPTHFSSRHRDPNDFVGEVFLRVSASSVIKRVGAYIQSVILQLHPTIPAVPEIKLEGHLDTTFPYILSHLEYIIGELLRNSIEATVIHHHKSTLASENASITTTPEHMPPVTVLICNAPRHIIFRFSDVGGGIPESEKSDLWSFAKSHRNRERLDSFKRIPKMYATLQELGTEEKESGVLAPKAKEEVRKEASLHGLTYRPPELKLGMGLPMSRVYAEYWGGSLSQTTMEGYGTDVFLQVEKLGNRLEQLNIDAL
ncbi:alpha-ketoacid dehydrogenase kinase [Ascodesmis nigricans]|uniref:Protein-serine/threonine kinase n=1 Tax=Ascodesmis nigricans TaxID=341454 RepID=A0A4S2MQH0_9PEZI|nr:alpha-ketoacid dehydrogenase kinase [Ascodesmis nigricans]